MTAPRLRADLLFHQLDDEILVFDPKADKVHLLDATTAKVMRELRADAHDDGADPTFDLAIAELENAELLESESRAPGVSRRDLLKKVAAGVLVPAIVTLSPSLAYGQGSCLPKKACCTSDVQCCSTKCDPSTNTGCQTGPLECH